MSRAENPQLGQIVAVDHWQWPVDHLLWKPHAAGEAEGGNKKEQAQGGTIAYILEHIAKHIQG